MPDVAPPPYRALAAPLGRLAVVFALLLAANDLMWRVALPAWTGLPRLALCLAVAVLAMYRWAAREMGYSPLTVEDLASVHLVHYSQLSTAELDPHGTGVVDLTPACCTYLSRMLRRDLFWPRTTVPAVYFFVGEPSPAALAGQVHAPRSRVLVDVALVRGPLFQRADGCVALPGGYRGPAGVSDVAAPP